MSRPHQTMQLKAEATDEGHIRLLSPEVGGFTGALPEGSTLSPGMVAGTLQVLGRSVDLVVPAGAGGAVVSAAPKLRVAPVGFGDELYRLDPEGVAAAAAMAGGGGPELEGDAMAVTATQSGRVWHSPSPGEPPFAKAGDVLEDGSPICLIEVMKTFSTVPYRAEGGLPARAKVVRWLANDGDDVEPGGGILVVEPA